MSTTQTVTKKSKVSFLLMIAIFVLPVILAKLALDFEWFNKGATNRGVLLDPIIQADSLFNQAEKKWHFLYILPKTCDVACENAIYATQQVYIAVGKEVERVNALFIATEETSSEIVQDLDGKTGIEILRLNKQEVSRVFEDIDLGAIFITDTLHNVVLYYPNTTDRQQAIMDSRDMLADMRKLLKLSRIG